MSAFITLLLNDGYLKGAQVLAHSLRDVACQHEIAVMVTRDVSDRALATLIDLYDEIYEVDEIANPSTDNLNLLGRLDLRSSLTKLNLWRQVQYDKVVFLDADTLILQNIDHLFDLDVQFAAAPDIGWPDIFNSGVFFARPSIGTYAGLRRLADAGVSFDGGDQGLLNSYFPTYDRLSFTYNVTPSSGYQCLPAYRHFESQVRVVHFIGAEKPWTRGTQAIKQLSGPYAELLARWWAVHDRHYPASYVEPVVPRDVQQSRRLSPPFVLDAIKEEQERAGSVESPPPFEAAQTAWDAQTNEPPVSGPPEAGQLQFLSYSNSWETGAGSFIPPSTPRIPKSVHFEPPQAPDANASVFPWEGKSVAQRSFPEDAIAPLREIIEIERNETPQSEISESEAQPAFADYSFSNAWDSIQEIKDYVASIPGSSGRPRAPSSVWGSGSNTPREAELPEGPSSPASQIPGSQTSSKTDFLLQEPAGLPKPQDWNPSAQLDQLAHRAISLAEEAAQKRSLEVDAARSDPTQSAAAPSAATSRR